MCAEFCAFTKSPDLDVKIANRKCSTITNMYYRYHKLVCILTTHLRGLIRCVKYETEVLSFILLTYGEYLIMLRNQPFSVSMPPYT